MKAVGSTNMSDNKKTSSMESIRQLVRRPGFGERKYLGPSKLRYILRKLVTYIGDIYYMYLLHVLIGLFIFFNHKTRCIELYIQLVKQPRNNFMVLSVHRYIDDASYKKHFLKY